VEDEKLDVTGGLNVCSAENEFQKLLTTIEAAAETGIRDGQLHPSSRNTAFRWQAWADVGGYPEWLTLAAEDALFTEELHKISKQFHYNPKAVVHWSVRPDETAYFKLLARNGYGSAEARLHAGYFWRRGLIVLLPPLLLLSRHRFRHLRFRYLKNFSSTRGWLAGKLFGQRPPPGWKAVEGILLSPEAQKHLLDLK
jgi:GT2 family glycosyltransferase